MTTDRVDFASLLASRLCHDLLSPIGAFANGLELLADEHDPAMRARCIDLLEQSARASAAKLKFFRLAFGSAGGFGDSIPSHEARDALLGIIGDKPIELNWMIGDGALPKPAIRIALNLGLILSDALVRGGRLDVGCEARDQSVEIALHAEGPRLILDPQVEAALATGEGGVEMTSRTAPAILVQALAAQHRGRVMLARETPTAMLIGTVIAGG